MPEKVEKEKTEKELQRKGVQVQLLRNQLNAMLEEKVLIDRRIEEMMETRRVIKKISRLDEGNEVWSSIGSGAYIRTDIKDIGKIAIDVGAGVIVKKGINEADFILQKRIDDLTKVDNELTKEINKLMDQVNKIESDIQKLARGLQ